MKNKTTPPFLSIITRSYKRSNELQRCINSVLNQTDPDFEHLIITDEVGHGIHWANCQITECASKVKGNYVYILDDDDFIVSFSFIEDFKKFITGRSVIKSDIIIICRGILNNEQFPKIWESKIKRGKITTANFIVSRQLFEKHAQAWNQPRAGDFHFLESAFKKCPHVFWWDYNAFCGESSCGLNETQKEELGFYG